MEIKSFGVATAIAVNKFLPAVDNTVANALVRADKALEENFDALASKSVNVGVAVLAKMATSTIAPGSLVDKGANLGLMVTGAMLASETIKTVKMAKSFEDSVIETEMKKLLEEGDNNE